MVTGAILPNQIVIVYMYDVSINETRCNANLAENGPDLKFMYICLSAYLKDFLVNCLTGMFLHEKLTCTTDEI